MQTLVMGPEHAPTSQAFEVFVETAGLTDVGRQRRKNEDQFLIATMQRSFAVSATSVSEDVRRWLPGSSAGTIVVVADGMGGGGDGDVASAVAIKAIADYLSNVMPWTDAATRKQARNSHKTLGLRAGLSAALAQGDAEVKKVAQSAGKRRRGMGTTLTMVYILWPQMYVAHAGDSRCYMFRNGQLSQLTQDHTYGQRAQGRAIDPQLKEMLWNALGEGTDLAPEVQRYSLQPGDVVLLCSDGLTKHVDDATIAATLHHQPALLGACHHLVAQANGAGGTDNITVALARCTPSYPPHSDPGPASGGRG